MGIYIFLILLVISLGILVGVPKHSAKVFFTLSFISFLLLVIFIILKNNQLIIVPMENIIETPIGSVFYCLLFFVFGSISLLKNRLKGILFFLFWLLFSLPIIILLSLLHDYSPQWFNSQASPSGLKTVILAQDVSWGDDVLTL